MTLEQVKKEFAQLVTLYIRHDADIFYLPKRLGCVIGKGQTIRQMLLKSNAEKQNNLVWAELVKTFDGLQVIYTENRFEVSIANGKVPNLTISAAYPINSYSIWYHEATKSLIANEGRGCLVIMNENAPAEIEHHFKGFMEALYVKPKPKQPIGNIFILQNMGKKGTQFRPFKVAKSRKFDVNDNYNDDFGPVNDNIIQTLSGNDGKGIVILHGLPGSGKSHYLRHLIGSINKKILYVPPSMVDYITDAGFMAILAKRRNSILVIEDAENAIRNRSNSQTNTASSILNITDGLLNDVLRIQVVVTFNSKLSDIDSAFLRKGRVIELYEFGKLSTDKAQKLAKKLGFEHTITEPTVLGDIFNLNQKSATESTRKKIGFGTAVKTEAISD